MTDPGTDANFRPDVTLIWISDPQGQAEFHSPTWSEFTGRPLPDLLGDGWFADIHLDDNPVLAAAIDRAITQHEDFRLRLRLRRHDGAMVPFSCDGVVRLDRTGRFAGLIGICTDITRRERERVEAELAGRHFVDLLPHTELVTLAVDYSGRVLFFNPALAILLGTTGDETDNTAILARFLDHQRRPLTDVLFPAACHPGELPVRIESEFIVGCEGRRILLWHAIPLRDYSGDQSGIILVGDDITASRLAEERLRLTASVFDTTDLAMIITDPRGTILSANAAFSQLTGYSNAEAVGSNPRILQSGRHDQTFYRALWTALQQDGRWQGEVWDKRKDGTVYPKYLSIHALRNENGEITHYSGVFYDISERKAAEERLTRLAHFDALTELPNRQFFLDRLECTCQMVMARKEHIALLYLDLDHFKEINDTFGHQAGDRLLQETGRRLRDTIRSQDMAARIGGDEFAVLLTDVKDAANAHRVAAKLLDAFSLPVIIDGQAHAITPSIGVALYPDQAGDPETLMRMADQAMYCVKAARRKA